MSLDISETFDRARDEQSYRELHEIEFVRNEGMKDMPSSSVILGADGQARASAEIAKADQKRQRDNADTQILLASLRQELQGRLNDIDERLEDIGDMRAGIEHVFENGYELNDDRTISNDKAEKSLREYEERTGTKVDRENEGAVMSALHEQWEEYDKETEVLNKEAKDIHSFIKNDLVEAQRLEKAGMLNSTERDALLEEGSKLAREGKGMTQTAEKHEASGYDSGLNAAATEIKADASSLMMGL